MFFIRFYHQKKKIQKFSTQMILNTVIQGHVWCCHMNESASMVVVGFGTASKRVEISFILTLELDIEWF